MAIDMHAHFFTEHLVDALRSRTEQPMIVEDGEDFVMVRAGDSKPLPKGFDSLDKRLELMDSMGIDMAVHSIPGLFQIEGEPIEASVPLTRANNDGVAAIHAAHPDRFAGLALLPQADMDAAVEEFDRAMGLPGIVGAIVPGNGFLTLKDAQAFRPLFEVGNRHKAIILVHTGPLPGETLWPVIEDLDNRWIRQGTLDMQQRLSANMITLCLTDFLDDYPDVTVMSHNLGGNIPFEVERMDHLVLALDQDAEPPSERFRQTNILIDCNSLGERCIERGVEVYGADKIVYGTDGSAYSMDWSNKAIAAARIDEADKRAILDGNAKAMLADRL